MPANTAPIYSKVGDIQWSTVASANTAKDGTGTVATIFTADATNGGRVERVRFRALGTNVATIARIFINNGSSNGTAANNILFAEATLPATTLSEVAALPVVELPQAQDVAFPLVLPPGYKLNVTLGTAVAAGYAVAAVGGKY